MIGKSDKQPQLNIFKIPLNQFIDPKHELVLLSKKVDWEKVEEDFSEYYCVDNGRPSIPSFLLSSTSSMIYMMSFTVPKSVWANCLPTLRL